MKLELIILTTAAMLMCRAYAQGPQPAATLSEIAVEDDHGNLKLQLVTSTPVTASVTIAHQPERIILRLPNTVDELKRGELKVSRNGVRAFWAVPSKDVRGTEVIIELDHPRPYGFRSERGQIVLTFTQNPRQADNALPAARRGSLTGIFHRKKKFEAETTVASNPAPAATVGVVGHGGLPAPPRNSSNFTIIQWPQKGAPEQSSAADSTASSGQPPPATATGPLSQSASSQPAQQAGTGPSFPSVTAGPSVSENASTATAVGAPAGIAASIPESPATSAPASTVTSSASNALPENPTEPVAQSANASPASEQSQAADKKTPVLAIRAPDPTLRTVFHVKYVAEGVAYLDGGRSSGLKEGVKLEIIEGGLPERDGLAVLPADPRVIAELEVSGVAETSAVTDVHSPKRPVKTGDLAYLSSADTQALVQETALSPTRKYPAVVSFTLDDPQDEEVREQVPRPPMPSVNRMRGRIGFDYMQTLMHGSGSMSSAGYGMMFRGEITRINGTYWNLSGYWRGRFTSQSASQGQTLQDLINRTYHLSMTYDSPNSAWVAGFGRLYLPWATSLDTIDGGYVGGKLSSTATAGIFGGSTPDPTSYDYSPNRKIAGTFVNFTGGDFSQLHYTSTVGAGASFLNWKLDRPFGFLENTISYTQRISLYDALQVDSPAGNLAVAAPGAGLSRNFFTLRVQPISRLELDVNETYFRDIPTFDPTLIGTGLLDKYLFQGFSGGVRAEVVKHVSVYAQLGRSSRTGDASSSLNELYGITFGRLPWYGLRADLHYARFNSAFGSGDYKSASISRNFGEGFTSEVLAGKQAFNSTMTSLGSSWFVTGRVETNLGAHYFIQANYTADRGQISYDQCLFTIGFRFDSKRRRQ